MKNLKRFQWALLLLVPIVVFAVMLPIARERRRAILTQQLLEEAHAKSRLEVMKNLVDQGADVNGRLPNWDVAAKGNSALHLLIYKYKTDQRPQLSLLLNRGANIDIRDGYGDTPLTLAASLGTVSYVRFLIGKGANINAMGNGATALGSAKAHLQTEKAKGGNSEKVPELEKTIAVLKVAGAKE